MKGKGEETAQTRKRQNGNKEAAKCVGREKAWGKVSNKVEFVDKSPMVGYSGIILKGRKMIPVKEIQDVIMSMGGQPGKDRHWLLCLAIYEARERWPERLQMKEIWAQVQRKAGKNKATAVSKALDRAVADLWEKGDREVLAGYQRGWRYDKPSPKDFIYVAAEHLWNKRGEGAA